MKEKNIFKEKLLNHTLPVRDGLWDAIEAQLPPEKDQKPVPLFWFTLFASTLLSGSLMFGTFNKKEVSPSSTLPLPAITLQDNHQTQENINSTTLSSSTTTPSKISTLSDQTITTNTKHQKYGKTNPSATTVSFYNPKSIIPLSSENVIVDHQGLSFTSSRNIEIVSFLPPLQITLSTEDMTQLEMSSLNPDPNCYKFGSIGSNFALSADLFAGPGFSPQSFEQTDTESSVYADARLATESYQYAWSAGARINLHLRNGLAARLGLTYTQTGDIFDYTDTLATQSSTRIDSFFASDGTFLYADTNRVLIFGTLIKQIHNTYRNLDIPLLFGYELPLGRSILMVHAGPVINLTSSHEGQILDPMLHPRSITSGEPGELYVYKTSLGLSLYLGAGFLIPLSDHISGLVEPSFLYRLKPVTLDSYALKEHRHYAGLNLGIRYHFN